MISACLWVAPAPEKPLRHLVPHWSGLHRTSFTFVIFYILHLLADFLIIAPSYQLCQAQLSLFVDLCSYFGVPIAPEKTRGPSTTLCFAGDELD